jgi:hypothetical protein
MHAGDFFLVQRPHGAASLVPHLECSGQSLNIGKVPVVLESTGYNGCHV